MPSDKFPNIDTDLANAIAFYKEMYPLMPAIMDVLKRLNDENISLLELNRKLVICNDEMARQIGIMHSNAGAMYPEHVGPVAIN